MRNAYSAFFLSGASALKIDIKSRKSSNDNFPSFLDENNSHNRSANGLYCKQMLFCLIYYKNNQFIIILNNKLKLISITLNSGIFLRNCAIGILSFLVSKLMAGFISLKTL